MEPNLSTRFPIAPSPPPSSSSLISQSPLHRRSDFSRIIPNIFPATAPPQDIESTLSSAGIPIPPPPAVVDQVLKIYSRVPWFALRFFRWAASYLNPPATTWNLLVDLLGENQLFDPMWDTISSMREHRLLSHRTFSSVFSSYCAAGRFSDAAASFDAMERYGLSPDVAAVNSLLGAICSQEMQTAKGLEFFEKMKSKIPPNGDTFAILLQGWEKEGNVAKAKTTFGEMVVRVGWSPRNTAAYDAFLATLVRGSQLVDAFKFLHVMKGNNCLPGSKFFSNTLRILAKQNDWANAVPLWDMMIENGVLPTLTMYNAMIGLLCSSNNIDRAYTLLDEMAFNGSFPDSISYNTIFECLIKNKMVREAGKFFLEMTKNEWPPTHSNCAAAIALLISGDDPEMAIEIWNFVVDNDIKPIDESANALLLGFCDLGRLLELRRFVEDMLDRRINICESTMEKLKNSFYKEGRKARDTYDSLSRRWKACKAC